MDLGLLYKENKEFKQYVDKYSNNYNEGKSITVEEALRHKLVEQVAEMYYNQPEENK